MPLMCGPDLGAPGELGRPDPRRPDERCRTVVARRSAPPDPPCGRHAADGRRDTPITVASGVG